MYDLKLFRMGFITVSLLLVFKSAQAQSEVQSGIHKFTSNIIQLIDGENLSDNFVISPFSLHSTFSQALIGAGGKTQTQLEKALGVTRSRSLADQYSTIHENLSSLKIANMLILNEGFEPKYLFMNFVRQGFGTQMKEFDFHNEKYESVEKINRIVESKTNQRIQNLLSPTDIDENLKMMIVNAVYFKAKWKQSFNPQDSFTSTFQSPQMGNVMTKFMSKEAEARVDETKDLDILELPYDDPSKSMIIFLPKADSVSEKIVDSVLQYPTEKIKKIQTRKTIVSLPKFEINYKLDLKSKMNSIGVSDMFSDRANFSYITNMPMKVSDGIHKAFIEVNEEGTEAAAATAVLFSFKSAGRQRRFFANRPFYFMIYDFQNKLPIFIGKFSNPSNVNLSTKKKLKTMKSKQSEDMIQTNEISQQQTKGTLKCQTYFETFGLAQNNNKECSYKGYRPYEWFVNNKSICTKSKQVYQDFFDQICGPAWCEYARKNYKAWKDTYGRECINQIEKQDVSSICTKLDADFKAKDFLSCSF